MAVFGQGLARQDLERLRSAVLLPLRTAAAEVLLGKAALSLSKVAAVAVAPSPAMLATQFGRSARVTRGRWGAWRRGGGGFTHRLPAGLANSGNFCGRRFLRVPARWSVNESRRRFWPPRPAHRLLRL